MALFHNLYYPEMFLKMKGDTSYMCETQAEGCTVYERSQNQRGISAAETGRYWRWFQDDEGTEHLSCERTGTVWLQGEKVQWRSGCPERFWSFHPRRYLKATWAWSWDFAVGGWPCLSRGLVQVASRGPFQPQPRCDSINMGISRSRCWYLTACGHKNK